MTKNVQLIDANHKPLKNLKHPDLVEKIDSYLADITDDLSSESTFYVELIHWNTSKDVELGLKLLRALTVGYPEDFLKQKPYSEISEFLKNY